jgi:hypothetical protein
MGMRDNIQRKESDREDVNVSESSSFCAWPQNRGTKAGAYAETEAKAGAFAYAASFINKFQPASAFHLPGCEELLSPLQVWPPEAPGPLDPRHETVLPKRDPGQPAWA